MAAGYNDPGAGEPRKGGDVERGEGPGASASDLPNQALDDVAAADLPPGGDVHPDHPDHPERQDERLEEALEETFPASDPVSAKHIT